MHIAMLFVLDTYILLASLSLSGPSELYLGIYIILSTF